MKWATWPTAAELGRVADRGRTGHVGHLDELSHVAHGG